MADVSAENCLNPSYRKIVLKIALKMLTSSIGVGDRAARIDRLQATSRTERTDRLVVTWVISLND